MSSVGSAMRKFGPGYLAKYGVRVPVRHRKAAAELARCRTAAAGGAVILCESCGAFHYRWRSCGNRNCPGCGGAAGNRWYERQADRLLPVPYFQVVFTLPRQLRRLVREHQHVLLPILMRTSAAALQKLARDPKYVGGDIAVTSALHTWGRNLTYHPHVHSLVPAGGQDKDGVWRPVDRNFLVPFKPLAKIFRAMFMKQARKALPPVEFPDEVWRKDWHVYAKRELKPGRVLRYLANYLFQTAISNRRILRVTPTHVSFVYRDHRDGKHKTMTVTGEEFLRRFLQHVLPKGMHRVRYYGLAHGANRHRLEQIRDQLTDGVEPTLPPPPTPTHEPKCPHCKGTVLTFFIEVPPQRGRPPPLPQPIPISTP